jgi:hypothetical protein
MATKHKRIYIARNGEYAKGGRTLHDSLDRLQVLINDDDRPALLKALTEAVPNFNHANGYCQQQAGAGDLVTLGKTEISEPIRSREKTTWQQAKR